MNQQSDRQRIESCLAAGDTEGAQEALRHLLEAHEQCHTLLAQASDAIVVFSVPEACILDFNDRAVELFGYSRDELKAATVCSLHPTDERESIKKKYIQVVQTGPDILHKIPVVCKDGRRLWTDVSAAGFDTGTEVRIQAIFHDITELCQLYDEVEKRNRELETKNAQLEEAQQVQTEFLALISHELRTPLNSIIGYNSLLQEGVYGDLQPGQHKAVERIDRNATRLLALINQLLELSRLQAGAISVFNEEMDLVSLVREVLDDYHIVAEEKGLVLDVAHPYGGLAVFTDKDKLREIIRQLVSNAIKFTPQGRVAFSLRQEGRRGVLEVKDTGPGIDPAQRDSLFGIFKPSELTSTRRYSGAGLGLAIVKRLADLMNVEIDLESSPGEGTVFILRIPQRSAKSPPEPVAVTATEPAANSQILQINEEAAPIILIVDDDPYTVEMLSDFLEARGGYKVQKAFSGMHAMIHLAQSCPAFLLVDLLMPQINGERVIQYARELWGGRVKIIVITGKELTPAERRSLEEKTDALIHKGEKPYRSLTHALEEIIPLGVRV